jgi:hypothetical protein
MKMLATLTYGKAQITQTWDVVRHGSKTYIILHEADDGKVVVPLNEALVKENSPGILPKHFYNGSLNASDAINLENSN